MTEQQIYQIVAKETHLRANQIIQTVQLLDEGATIPFLARYRKERTGSLDEVQIRLIQERVEYLRSLEKRKKTVLSSIEEQGKLTPELKAKIEATTKLQDLEDLYLPYKPKKRTRASIAREKGLQALADLILEQQTLTGDPLDVAAAFMNPETGVNTPEEALQGAQDIVAETISENADIRGMVREVTFKTGIIVSEAKNKDEKSVFEMYYEYTEPISKIPSHRILAINRGEKEGILKVDISVNIDDILLRIGKKMVVDSRSIFHKYLLDAIRDGYQRLTAPSIEREIRSGLTETAEKQAIRIFALNLKNLFLQPPISGKIIMGIDPGFRTGSKVAVIDKTGKYLAGVTIYPHPPQNEADESKVILKKMILKYNVDVIAIGNGTASRETESLVADLICEMKTVRELYYVIVSEAGASVYSASKIAQEEFPDLEASLRGNISIARRLLDPLAELVKIEPKSIGVGQYQHDVNQKRLTESLHSVIEDCVNHVGVDLNTASLSLLTYVSGLTSRNAANIVSHREKNGCFKNREQLKNVLGIGVSIFEQAAGFLRISGGENPLDNTWIHPESYEATNRLLKKYKIENIRIGEQKIRLMISNSQTRMSDLAVEIGIGEPTLKDILTDLEKPGRDPREELPKPILKSDILKIEDLKEGMILKGTVRNVVDFGVFVDIGVKQAGLVHISQISDRFVKNPSQVVSVGDIVDVRVILIDIDRGRIQLSMKSVK
ncbi:MAG: RNA-binding transcriptional accessory protein [Candidatus Marinimicrobia bacterium CG08_land_8_20_14_0_20_45_22]|nr:MAG: RNA-binding transcriptional accessory protein [Candidatus Marinimicrobia bacterium CG08_land_8_20_14_0_20_45_22]